MVHVSAVAKNAADDKLRNAMRKFAHNFSPPATVVLISGDINFAGELSDLRDRHSFNIVLVHNTWTNDQLKAFAHKTYLWEDFVEDVEGKKEKVGIGTCGWMILVVVNCLFLPMPPLSHTHRDPLSPQRWW